MSVQENHWELSSEEAAKHGGPGAKDKDVTEGLVGALPGFAVGVFFGWAEETECDLEDDAEGDGCSCEGVPVTKVSSDESKG